MKKRMLIFVVVGLMVFVGSLLASSAIAQEDREGSKDHPLFTRMPGFYIYQYKDTDFDSFEFATGPQKKETVEGHTFVLNYEIKEGTKAPSSLQIVRNHMNAIKAVGGQVVYDEPGGNYHQVTLRLTKDGKDTWVQVFARGDSYELVIVEKQGMQQEVTSNAESFARDLKATGKTAVYGIYFDTNQSVLKPESDQAIAEIAKLLKQNPTLKVYVVGHTDMVGDAATNVKLSMARAQAVINALVSKHGIAVARLIAFGNGPYAPVASNKDEEGRAKNRRVELVEIATK